MTFFSKDKENTTTLDVGCRKAFIDNSAWLIENNNATGQEISAVNFRPLCFVKYCIRLGNEEELFDNAVK